MDGTYKMPQMWKGIRYAIQASQNVVSNQTSVVILTQAPLESVDHASREQDRNPPLLGLALALARRGSGHVSVAERGIRQVNYKARIRQYRHLHQCRLLYLSKALGTAEIRWSRLEKCWWRMEKMEKT